MHNFFEKFNEQKKGFTLIETLVAVSIFTVSVLTLIILLSQGLMNTSYAKQKMIAGYLAQEGIEYIRNMRDTYVLYYSTTAQVGWDAFYAKLTSVGTSCQLTDGCYFDDRNVSFTDATMPMTDLIFTACSSSTCSSNPLFYDSSTGKYHYISGVSSGFFRQIKISQINVNEIKVSSTVYWNQGSGSHNINLTENLFNWVE